MIADPENRARWKHEKGMLVFQMWSDAHRETPVGLFTVLPFDFSTAYERAEVEFLAPERSVRLVPIDLLISMKEEAGRPRDLDDIEHLRHLREIRATRDD